MRAGSAQAGIHESHPVDSRLRGNDELGNLLL